MTTAKQPAPSAAETIAAAKSNIAALIAQLQSQIAAIPDSTTNWGYAGDAHRIAEVLRGIVGGES